MSVDRLRAAIIGGRYEDAWAIYLELHDSDDPQVHYLGGRAQTGMENWVGARQPLERALQAGADGELLGQVRMVLGETLRAIGDHRGAVELLQLCIAEWHRYESLGTMWLAATQYNLGLAYRQSGKLTEAVEAYRAAIAGCAQENMPQLQGKALRNLAWAQCLMGDLAGASESLDQAARFCEGSEAHWHQRVGWALWEACSGRHVDAMNLAAQIAGDSVAPTLVRSAAFYVGARAAQHYGALDEARDMADSAMALAGQARDVLIHIDAARLRAEVLQAMQRRAAGA